MNIHILYSIFVYVILLPIDIYTKQITNIKSIMFILA